MSPGDSEASPPPCRAGGTRPPAGGDFYARVYEVVAQIPPGRVTTYGRIARALGAPRASRGVGWALKAVARAEGALALPCHRVVNREGRLTGRKHFETPTVMEERLRSESVSFRSDGSVDLSRHLWEIEQ